ncbi:DNA-binding SAP [Metarhizium album ARSEF 1941]|uniref:DNA-binding SAP n=1 Tax=Metarhizium album (strain ARSEF 1941) TaxID=1081103 RepID=A0A0B2X525_METAS|nr:DNA-binding SAP [Metarhizium album ARSEF 1941]KHO00555.1 DNA-binding SAP [Metarhizium album ARSEF 1941]
MTDYNTLKVPELKAVLGQRKLPQTGNKQALITRLQEDDDKAAAAGEGAKPEAAKEDEITYSDEEAAVSKPAAEVPVAAATESNSREPAKKEEALAPTDADAANAKTDDAEPAQSFAIGLASTAADEEAKKRADRAKRFGIEEDEDAKKRADRAKRFGLDQTELASGLDSALPERPLKRGRGRDGGDGRPGKRQSLDRRGRQGRGPRQGDSKERGRGILSDAVERAKAEKRAARFAAV